VRVSGGAVFSGTEGRTSPPRDSICSREVIPLRYKGQSLALAYRPDLICFGSIIVEVKALSSLGGLQFAQAINYLRASGLRRALVLNFGTTSLGYKRLVFGLDPSQLSIPRILEHQICGNL